MDNFPTPEGTPTQIYIRFEGEEENGVRVVLGCDGEETAPPRTLHLMATLIFAIGCALETMGDYNSSGRALALYRAILKQGGKNAGAIS